MREMGLDPMEKNIRVLKYLILLVVIDWVCYQKQARIITFSERHVYISGTS